MEFILGMLFSPIAFGVFILAALWLEHMECHGWTVFVTLIIGVIAWKLFELSPTDMGIIAAMYIPIGIGWSFWRFRRYCQNYVNDLEGTRPNSMEIEYFRHDTKTVEEKREAVADRVMQALDPRKHVQTMVYWIVGWPFSMLEMLIGDVIDMVETMVRTVFRNTYQRIADAAVKRAKEIIKSAIPDNAEHDEQILRERDARR